VLIVLFSLCHRGGQVVLPSGLGTKKTVNSAEKPEKAPTCTARISHGITLRPRQNPADRGRRRFAKMTNPP